MKSSNKGFAPIVIILIVAGVLALAGGGYWWWRFHSYQVGSSWEELSIPGQFKILFPSHPNHKSKDLPTNVSGQVTHGDYYISSPYRGGPAYALTVYSFSHEVDSGILINGLKSCASNTNESLLSSSTITLFGYDGLDFFCKDNSNQQVYLTRTLLVANKTLYNLTITYSDYDQDNFQKFINSFQLLE